jgi:hypothetical protein
LTRYISAMNVPEMGTREEHRTSEGVGPAYRVSEATLGFTREAWVTRPFLDIQMGEGAGFMLGREEESVEINPTNVIVSFIHTKNTSSRRVPAAQEPNVTMDFPIVSSNIYTRWGMRRRFVHTFKSQ